MRLGTFVPEDLLKTLLYGKSTVFSSKLYKENSTMKHATIKIKIAEPCHENWDKMLEEEKGRFCLSCQKAVVDFSRMTNEDIINYFEQNAGKKVCGRISKHQHNTPISNYRKVITPWFNKYVAGFLMAVGFYNPAKGQTTNAVPEQHMMKGEMVAMPVKQTNKKLVVTGRVLAYDTKKGLIGAVVSINGSDIKTKTDKNGSYSISVPERFQNSNLQLVVSHEGYSDAVISNLDQSKTSVSIITKLLKEIPQHMMGDIMVEPEPTKSK